MTDFSVTLGLVDYVNVALAVIFYIYVCRKLKPTMRKWLYRTMLAGAIISIFMAFWIPTIKVMVGFGLFKFETPKAILSLTYIGFFLFGSALFLSTCKKFKPNSKTFAFDFYIVGVLFGGIGRILIYVSLIKMCVKNHHILPIVIFALSLLVQLFQIYEASGGSVPIAWFHWVIEFSNITSQALLLLGTWVLFRKNKKKTIYL